MPEEFVPEYSPDTPIEDVALSVRTFNALSQLNLRTFGELCRIPDEGLRLVYGLGKVGFREIRSLTGPPQQPHLTVKSSRDRFNKTGARTWIAERN